MERQRSLGMKLVISFMVTSIIPIILIIFFSYYNILKIVNENNQELMKYNLSQTKTTLEISMKSYEDVLYQIYSDDNIVSLINKINDEEDQAVSKNQLRRTLRGYFYIKEYIRDISILTEDGNLVFYDTITGSTTRSSWIPDDVSGRKELYDRYINENKTFVLSTEEVKESLNERNFLFHLGHRIVDFNRKNKNIAVVMIGIDEEMLHNICTGNGEDPVTYSFIVDREGKLVSYRDEGLLGTSVEVEDKDKRQAYWEFANQQDTYGKYGIAIDFVHEDRLDWDIVSVSNQYEMYNRIDQQQKITFTMLALSVVFLLIIIVFLIKGLTGSIKSIVRIMQSAQEGKRQERVEIDRRMPSEVKVIAYQYNMTMDRLLEAVETEKRLDREKKDAEITALEAQINPHFLYNTLDTINWIAIGKKEFEVSRAITALASILRYGIDNSNGVVTIREEYEWLKQYLLLQQTRLKDGFESSIDIPPEVMEVKVHKLLIQPFVENSFIHGFKNCKRIPELKIQMELQGRDRLRIVIEDNGTGMPDHVAEQMNRGIFEETENKSQIGLQNALYRIQLYYEEQAEVRVESKENEYTRIWITLPVSVEEERDTI